MEFLIVEVSIGVDATASSTMHQQSLIASSEQAVTTVIISSQIQ